jgi:RNA polymerase sigma-70 factor (ECF subfamily)
VVSAALDVPAERGAREFGAIVREHGPVILRALRRLGVREADVPDVAQDVFVTLHKKLPEFEGRSTLRTFLYGIAVRVASDYRKSAYVRRERATDELPERAGSAPELKALEQKERLRMLDQALDALDPVHREVLVLFEIEELSMKDVALAIGCPEKTAYGRLYAAREALKRAFLKLDPEGGPT